MRVTALAAVLTIVPGLALAQDASSPPKPTGTMLLDALPAEADIVVHTPDLPALLASASKAGLGTASVWRAAFDQQMRAWGAPFPTPERVVRGGGVFLDAADGEVLLAAVDVKLPTMSRPHTRTWLFAMRTTQTEKTLRAALSDVYENCLRAHLGGEPRDEEIGGRRVVAMPGTMSTLYVLVQDGLVAASDHPLILGLFLNGLAKGAKAASGPQQGLGLALTVRHGTGAAKWEGWVWNDVETVQWKADDVQLASILVSLPDCVFAVADNKVELLPLFPSPVSPPTVNGRTSCIGLKSDGTYLHSGAAASGPEPFSGAAWRLAWLRALAAGHVASPFPAVDQALLGDVYDSAAKSAGKSLNEFLPWRSKEPGHLRGPLGHGPTTFLALRSIHDIAHGVELTPEPTPEAPKPRPAVPLPPPTEPTNK